MKHEKWLSCLTAAVLAFALALAGAGCLVTAFDLQPVSLAAVAVIYAAWAALCALCFTLRHGVLALAAGGALLMGFLLRQGKAMLQVEALIYKVSWFYNAAYGVGVVSWSGKDLAGVPVNGALLILGGIVILLTAWAVCRRKNVFWAIGVGFLPMAACFVVTDTIPHAAYVWLMVASVVLLLLPQSVRKRDAKEGLRLTALLLIPVLLASMLLFWCNPQKTYWDKMEQVRGKMMSWVAELPFVEITPDGNLAIGNGGSGPKEDLRSIGPKTLRKTPVMDVISPKSDFMYLRGQSLDTYSGVGWDASPVSTGEDPYFPSKNMENIGLVTISTRMYQVRRYVPYYADKYVLKDGAVENKGDSQEYFYRVQKPVSGGNFTLGGSIPKQCLTLPDSTRAAAEDIVDRVFGVGKPQDTRQVAQALQSYVRSSARYSLNTPKMPAEETDFAIWFLQESDTGYCVHFASALAVLLRAADIPARYVTGYAFEVRAGMKTVVRASDAHAWVEYLDPRTGWTVLDATPEDWTRQEETETTKPTEVTEPVVTDPTEPTDETEATETTQPDTEPEATTQATSPGGDTQPGEESKINLSWLMLVLWIAGLAAVLVGQYSARRAYRRRRMGSGQHNKRALYLWQEVKRMARTTGKTPPEQLKELAEKAKFSQHTLTEKELQELEAWLEQAGKCLQEKPWIVRLVLRLIWAVE